MTTSTPIVDEQNVKLAIVLVTAHDHLRFETSVPVTTTVSGLKELLFKTLAGRPHPSGQSLTHLGRTLENSEVLGQMLNVRMLPTVSAKIVNYSSRYPKWTCTLCI